MRPFDLAHERRARPTLIDENTPSFTMIETLDLCVDEITTVSVPRCSSLRLDHRGTLDLTSIGVSNVSRWSLLHHTDEDEFEWDGPDLVRELQIQCTTILADAIRFGKHSTLSRFINLQNLHVSSLVKPRETLLNLLKRSIPFIPKLKTLTIRNNDIKNEDLYAYCNVLEKAKSIRTLDISENPVSCNAVCQFCTTFLRFYILRFCLCLRQIFPGGDISRTERDLGVCRGFGVKINRGDVRKGEWLGGCTCRLNKDGEEKGETVVEEEEKGGGEVMYYGAVEDQYNKSLQSLQSLQDSITSGLQSLTFKGDSDATGL